MPGSRKRVYLHVRLLRYLNMLINFKNSTLMIFIFFVTSGYTVADVAKPDSGHEGLVFIKGGCFDMGDTFGDGRDDEQPVHEVCVDDFYMGKYEITQQEWLKIMGNNTPYFKGCEDCPVSNVSWNDIQEFIKRLKDKTGLNYRLPTEAEWEYTAKDKGKQEKWAGTSKEAELGEYSWYYDSFVGNAQPIGKKLPNTLGIYDMSGNVWEWCRDWYDKSYYSNSPKHNPEGPSSGKYRVLRGGSWYYGKKSIRTSSRFKFLADIRYDGLGFRLALSAK